jgi:thiosulfate/3-mercaptopyruvate sulfurtransferase
MSYVQLSLLMQNFESPLIDPKDLPLGSCIVIDARSGPDAYQRFASNHLVGALHVDVDRDLSQKPFDPAYGGRHPLPDLEEFTRFLGNLGITPSSHVIVYDDKHGANAAARFWWMLRALGHNKVQVVNGGLDAIIQHRLPMSSDIQNPTGAPPYPANVWRRPTVGIHDVMNALKDGSRTVIDVREGYRFRGESEPIDLIAGHIPGAINVPYLDNLSEDGTFRSAEELASQFKNLLGKRNASDIIVHCGSGVTACHTLLAMEHAGLKGASLYVGSWSEWSRRDLPVGTGNE